MTIHPRDIASRIAATEAILDDLSASEEAQPPQSPEPEPAPAPASTPAPPAPAPAPLAPAERHDGWTRARQTAFLNELAASHNVSAAARAVGMTRQSAYKLRARLRGEPFDMAWGAAFQSSFDLLAEAAIERAINGVEVPHFYQGELVHTSRHYDERLTLGLLAMRQNFLCPPAPHWHPASACRSDDFAALVAQVEHGAGTWAQQEEADSAEDEAETRAAARRSDTAH